MHFFSYQNLTNFGVTVIVFDSTDSTDDKSALTQLISWHRFGASASAVAMMTKPPDSLHMATLGPNGLTFIDPPAVAHREI